MIKDLRKKAGLKQYELAELLEVDQTAISQWECGRTSPTAGKLLKLADLFGCTVDELLRQEAQPAESGGKKGKEAV